MIKVSLLFLLILLNSNVNAKNIGSEAEFDGIYEKYRVARDLGNDQSAEQLQELEELIKSLEERINAGVVLGKTENHGGDIQDKIKDAEEEQTQHLPTCSKAIVLNGQEAGRNANPNPRDRTNLSTKEGKKKQRVDAQAKKSQEDGEAKARLDKRKTGDLSHNIDELEKEAYKLRIPLGNDQHHLSDFEKEQQYYQSLVRLQQLYDLYNKRYLGEKPASDDRASRHCGDQYLSRKMDHIQEKKYRYMERSRLVADRIATSAVKLATKKGQLLDHIFSPLCGCCRCGDSTGQVSLDESLKRDVAVSTATSSDTVVETKVGNSETVSSTSVDKASSTVADAGGISTSHDISKDHHSEINIGHAPPSSGFHPGMRSGSHHHSIVGSHRGGHMSGYAYPEEDYEKKMIMDMAIEEAAGMIRNLAHETRSEVACRSDPNFERRVLGLAIDLVNKVTTGVTGDIQGNFDHLAGFKYNNVDDYLKSSNDNDGTEHDLVSNSGFDYVNYGLARSQGLVNEMDPYDDYIGHSSPYSRGRCENCGAHDGFESRAAGSESYLCKRHGHVFQGRTKRKSDMEEDNGKIHHLEHTEEVQKKRSKAASGMWEDVNKLYNFKDFENNKFIDLSMNCTEDSDKPDCQRLHYDLKTPKDADPVPLWFVRDNLRHGRDLAADMHDRALGLRDGLQPAAHSPSQLHFLNNRASSSIVKLNEESQKVLFGTKVLQEKLMSEYNMTPDKFLEFLRHHGFRVTGSEICRARHKRCNSLAKFRSHEGSCNNFKNPSWGQSNTAFVRILPARYADGIHAMPVSVLGGPLPNPRALSARLFSRLSASDATLTLALMQWGQIVAHDFARQLVDQTEQGGIECCEAGGGGPLPKSLQHHSCLPIVVPRTDGFYARYNQTCMNFVRSMTVTREDCSLGPANQLNGVSSFLDLNPVYGADRARSQSLRELHGGRMLVELRADRVMMPTASKSGYCDARTSADLCFETGDVRTNQNPQLVVLQTLFIREHNRIADELAALNPHWDDERLYQESRLIVIAQYQHITYNHWLPHILGKRYCKEHRISPASVELSNDYDVRVNPTTINGFTSGAFRFLHSIIEGNVNLFNDNYSSSSSIRLSEHYFRPGIVEPNNNFEALLRGLVHQTVQKPDANFHEEVTEYLFRSLSAFGMDLEALDIQRGRDHGIPGYNAYREICQLQRAQDFHGLISEISLNDIEKLQSAYRHVDDIDLLVGAAMESRMPGSMLGPTLRCLIGEQFYRARVGDKYFYNNANFEHSFTPEQFAEIKKASLATLVCDLGEAVYEIQRDAFRIGSNRNQVVSCFNLPKINLEFWKEEYY